MDLKLHFILLILVGNVVKVDSIDLNDKQNQGCAVSTYCERTLKLECKDRSVGGLPLQLTGENAWDAVCRSLEGKTGQNVVLTLKGRMDQVFEVRELCVDVTNAARIDWKYTLRFFPTEDTRVVKGPEKQTLCVERPQDEHKLGVKSVQITVVPQSGRKVRISLRFLACGDQSGLGRVNAFPGANNVQRKVQFPPDGHQECFDQYTLDYRSRGANIISFTDGLPGRKEDNALTGSGQVYTGQPGQDVKFAFTVQLTKKNEKFVWWKVCFLIRHVGNMTFRMLGDTDNWIQTIKVCDPENYLWKCYNPWDRFDEITKGEIILEAGSNKAIRVQEMSITVCRDNEFAGKIVRIGRATVRCKPEDVNTTDICDELIRIGGSDAREFDSPFYFSDDPTQVNTRTAWSLLNDIRAPYVAPTGTKEVSYSYTLQKHCSQLGDNRFQARSIQVWAKNVRSVVVKFCDTGHPLHNKELYCRTNRQGLPIWDDPSTGLVVRNFPKKPGQAAKIIINNWFTVTSVRVLFIAATPATAPMEIWSFNIFACCDPSKTMRDLTPPSPAPAEDQQAPRVTLQRCATAFLLKHQKKQVLGRGLFEFDDRDMQRDETLALEGSDGVYMGRKGRNIYFYISFKDKTNFEMWKICGHYLNIGRVTYVMETSRVTFIQSKIFCGINKWQRTCYYPRNEGVFVSRAAVMMEVEPGRAGHIKWFTASACRDHFSYRYALHMHPCDFKSMVMVTPTDQRISIYAVKDKTSRWLQTEVYHFTDKTGNDGDNTWFMLEPQYHLVSAIWTKRTYMDLAWDVINKKVTFQIYITGESNRIHSSITLLNLKDLEKLLDGKFETKSIDVDIKDLKHCHLVPYSLSLCGKKARSIKLTAEVMSKGMYTVPGYFVHQTKEHNFLLPKGMSAAHTQNQVEGTCSSVTKVFETECERHAIFNRTQHQFICSSMRSEMSRYDTVSTLEVSDMYQACLYTYKTIRWTCAVMAGRPRQDSPVFFSTACTIKSNFSISQLNNKLDSGDVSIKAQSLDSYGQAYSQPTTIRRGSLATQVPSIKVQTTNFVITGISTDPKEIPEVHSYNYTVCVKYECANGRSGEELQLMPRGAPDATTDVTVCTNLKNKPCCVEMARRTRKNIIHSVMILYFPDGKKKSLQQEELIQTVR